MLSVTSAGCDGGVSGTADGRGLGVLAAYGSVGYMRVKDKLDLEECVPSCPRFFAAMSISLLVIGSVISASAQWAEWTAQVSGPDVFGNTKVIAVVPAQDRTSWLFNAMSWTSLL